MKIRKKVKHQKKLRREHDLNIKRLSVTLVLMMLLILSTAGSVVIATSQSNNRVLSISPAKRTMIAQYEISEPLIIQSNMDFEALGATGTGTLLDPFTFDGLQISNASSCIQVVNTTAYFVISYCKLESDDTYPVIVFDNVENGQVEHCEVSGLSTGIDIWQSQDCNVIESSFVGVWHGVRVRSSSSCLVLENTIRSNQRGIFFQDSEFCDVLNNSLYDNSEYGVFIDIFSHNNSVYGNSIGWNARNVWDVGVNNTFDDGVSLGNAWSDYNASEPYLIPGTGGAIDAYAELLNDTMNPSIVPLEDIAIDVESVGNTLSWMVYDLYLVSYAIVEDNVITVNSIWIEGNVIYGLDHLRVGTHSITLVLTDASGNIATDEVLVTAVSFLLGGIGTEFVLYASGVTVACFIIIILLIKKLS